MLDFILSIFLILGFLLGLKEGMIKKIFSFLGVFIGLFVAYKYFRFVNLFVIKQFHLSPQFSALLSFIIIFLIIYIVFKIFSKIFEPKSASLSVANRIIGGIIGIAQAAIVLSFLLIGVTFFQLISDEMKSSSVLYSNVVNIAPRIIDIFSTFLSQPYERKPLDSLQQNSLPIVLCCFLWNKKR
ncbi:MAG: hypothetical protein FJ218_01730 [Ignavibacteria bacterium]|nr:hypothetical protein [Ignavibacteria bacterium]